MNIDPRLDNQVNEHPYPLLFTTISGAHLYGFPSPDLDFAYGACICCPWPKLLD